MNYPLARTTDPETSHQAPESPKLNELQNMVLSLFDAVDFGLTDSELRTHFANKYRGRHINPETPRKRRSDLKNMGLVVDSGYRRKNAAGKNEVVWELKQ